MDRMRRGQPRRRGVIWLGLMLAMPTLAATGANGRTPVDRPHAADSLDRPGGQAVVASFDRLAGGCLEDYLHYAAQRNPGLKAAFEEWNVAMERAGYAGKLPDPSISYSYFVESVETRVGPQNQRVMVRQSFPWFGTLSTHKDVTTEAAKAAFERLEARKQRLFYEVESAYYEYYYRGREIAVTRDALELLTFWESVARAKYRVALKQHPDVIKAQVELGKLEDRLRTVEAAVAPVVARLRALLALPEELSLPLPGEIDVLETAVGADSIVASVIQGSPGLRALGHGMDRAAAGRRLAGKLTRPEFFVSVDYIDVGPAQNPLMAESGKDAWMASVGLSLPIWFGANQARRAEAEAQYRGAQYQYDEAENQLRALAHQVIFEYEDALRKMRLYRDGLLPKAEQSLNASYTAYQAGEADFLDVLDAQRELLDFQLQYERSRSNVAIRMAEMKMLAGTLTERGDENR